MVLCEKRNLASALIGFEQLEICSNDQFYTLTFRRLVGFDKTKKVSSVCYRDRGHMGGGDRLH
jgi:hypothetical protein